MFQNRILTKKSFTWILFILVFFLIFHSFKILFDESSRNELQDEFSHGELEDRVIELDRDTDSNPPSLDCDDQDWAFNFSMKLFHSSTEYHVNEKDQEMLYKIHQDQVQPIVQHSCHKRSDLKQLGKLVQHYAHVSFLSFEPLLQEMKRMESCLFPWLPLNKMADVRGIQGTQGIVLTAG